MNDKKTSSSTSVPQQEVVIEQKGSDGCVDVEILKKRGIVDMVYKENKKRWTLCDDHGNCATPGHMIEWNGNIKMMKRYCQDDVIGGCNWQHRWVNSPKGRWKSLRVRGENGIKFTAAAAKWQSQTEEVLLRWMVRRGL